MKTIRDLADELSVSKTTINALCESLNMKSELIKRGNRYYINETQELRIREQFAKNQESKTQTCDSQKSQTDFAKSQSEIAKSQEGEITALLEKANADLERANERIKEMQRNIDELTAALVAAQDLASTAQKLADQAQQLNLLAIKPKRRRTLREWLFGISEGGGGAE